MYTLNLSHKDMQALGWLANRYESARVLYDALTTEQDSDSLPDTTPIEWQLREHQAWEFKDVLEKESEGIIPCLDYRSHLGEEILRLEQAIV